MTPNDNPVVLVIEDDPPVRELLDDVLEEVGYEVVVAHDGAAGLRILESLKVDLITLDLDLPGLTGSELLQLLRRRKLKIPPVVVVTGQAPVKKQTRQMAQAVITKPFDVDDLIQAVLSLLPKYQSGEGERVQQVAGAEVSTGDVTAQPGLTSQAEDTMGYVKARGKRSRRQAE